MLAVNWGFWAGIIVAGIIGIPLSILSNLLTPRWQAWRSRRNEAAAANRRAADDDFDQRVSHLASHPERFFSERQNAMFHSLLMVLTAMASLIAALTITSSVSPGEGSATESPNRLVAAGFTLAFVSLAMAGVLAAYRTWNRSEVLAKAVLGEMETRAEAGRQPDPTAMTSDAGRDATP